MAEVGKGGKLRDIIFERIDILLSLAEQALKRGEEAHARRYVFLARKLSTRHNCRLTPFHKVRFCKCCGLPMVVGINASVRLRKRTRTAEYLCGCGKSAHFKY
ncbi:TPA: hypothetical protein HA225_05010 [Candidatus Micrarchaeota archaeon]|nr:hypothetical protein [Candidatus Micrarchaeota archaeon]